MESVSDIDLLQDRPLFKLGLIAHDYRKTVIASVLIVCFSLGSSGKRVPQLIVAALHHFVHLFDFIRCVFACLFL